jgi:hypothetical protein
MNTAFGRPTIAAAPVDYNSFVGVYTNEFEGWNDGGGTPLSAL